MSKMKKKHQIQGLILVALIVVLAALLVWIMVFGLPGTGGPVSEPGKTETVHTTSNTLSASGQTEASVLPLELGNGLTVTYAGAYNGAFMEDGSNEIVSGVFMIRVENRTENDLQYGEIILGDGNKDFRFQVTNLPASRQVILLEQDRASAPDEFPAEAETINLAWFSEPMSVQEDMFRISGAKGAMNVENIAQQDISGDIYVYYKYQSDDHLFGGITFRTKIEGGLAAGELRQIPSGHYNPETCIILDVKYYEP